MREEVGAALAAHKHLGSDYEAEVADSLVERIGSEIDRRVDARLAGQDRRTVPQPPIWASLVMGLGSITLGVGATGAVLNAGTTINSTGIIGHAVTAPQAGVGALIWIVIAAVNLAYFRRR